MKNVAVLTEDGAFALFFRLHPGDLTAQESPPPGREFAMRPCLDFVLVLLTKRL